MKRLIIIIVLAVYGQIMQATVDKVCDVPDSVYILPYTTVNDIGRSGLRFAWSPDAERWMSVADGYRYIRSDFGSWKTMIKPRLIKNGSGWRCV